MTGLSALSRLDVGVGRLRLNLETLTRQVSDERKGPYLGDIAPEVRRAIDLRGEIDRRAAYTIAIEQSIGQTSTTQNAMETLYQIAKRAFVLAQSASSLDASAIGSVAAEARSSLEQVAQVLNQQYGDQYVFGGKDSKNPPVPNPSGILGIGLVTEIASTVAGLGAGNADAIWAATLPSAASDVSGTTPFSDYLSDPARGLTEERRSIPGADGRLVSIGIFANRNAVSISQGDTTGSWSRDLMRGLSALAALDPAQAALGPDFDALMENIRGGLRVAVSGIAQEQGALGVAEKRLEVLKTDHANITTTLSTLLNDVENVDLALVISRMQATRTQLEASYQAISLASQLTLARFL